MSSIPARNAFTLAACSFTLLACLLLPGIARASEAVLSHSSGPKDAQVSLRSNGQYTVFQTPVSWPTSFAQSITFYAIREGDPGDREGFIVFWKAMKDGNNVSGKQELIGRKSFKLADIPEGEGWFTVELDSVELPKVFGVSIYTFSTEDASIAIGLSPRAAGTKPSNSYQIGGTGGLALDSKPNPSKERREWLMRLIVRDTLAPRYQVQDGELRGPSFAAYDDGSAEGFYTVQKNGPLLRFDNSAGRTIKRVHVYGQTSGEWLKSTLNVTVTVMNLEYGILARLNIPYSQFTNVPAWIPVDVPNYVSARAFHVLVEPNSRPQAQFSLGYDTSGQNTMGQWATSGALLDWQPELEQQNTNWMIRVEYSN